MEKRRLNPSKSSLVLKNINPRILWNFERTFSKKIAKIPSSHIFHSLGGKYCWLVSTEDKLYPLLLVYTKTVG